MKRTIDLRLIALAAVLAAGCKDGTGPGLGPPGEGERGAPVTATITEAGGTLRAVTEDGAVLTLDFPAGAVGDGTLELTLSPRPAGAGAWARLELRPSGVRLERPVEIRLTAPEGRTIDGSAFRFGAPGGAVLLPTGRDAASRTLSTRTQLLGYGAGLAAGGASSWAPGEASMAVAAAGSPSFSLDPEGPGALFVGEVSCAQALASMEARVEGARDTSFASAEAAHALLSEIEAVTLLCGENPGDEAALAESIAELKVSACQGYDEARTNASVLFIDDAEMLHTLLVPVLGWEATKQLVGTDCGLPGNDFLELIAAKYDQFIDSYTERIKGPDFGEGIFRAMWGEIVVVYDIAADAQLLGLVAAEAKTYDVVLPAVLDRLREEGYRACRDDESQSYLADVLSGGHVFDHAISPSPMAHARFSAEELERDIQLCASRLTVTGFDGVEPLGSRELHGGAIPGEHVTEGALSVPLEEGVLALQGDVHAFTCLLPGQAVTLGSDELVIKVDGEEVRRLQHGGGRFFTSALELDVEGILEQAGLDPEGVESFELTVSREGPACEGHYGDGSFKLFTVAVEVGELVVVTVSPTEATVHWPATQQFTATVTGTADKGVTWHATGGRIDSTGLYTAPPVRAGSYTVTARSVVAPASSAEAEVTVIGVSPYSGYYEGERRLENQPGSDAAFLSVHVLHRLSSGSESLGSPTLLFDWRFTYGGPRARVTCAVDWKDHSFGPCIYNTESPSGQRGIGGTFAEGRISGVIIHGTVRFTFEVQRVSDCAPFPVSNPGWGRPECQ